VPPATLHAVADHIHQIVTSGQPAQRKALVEALIDSVKITAPDRLVPIYRIPQATAQPDGTTDHAAGQPAAEPTEGVVRAMTNTVRRQGLEPRTRRLRDAVRHVGQRPVRIARAVPAGQPRGAGVSRCRLVPRRTTAEHQWSTVDCRGARAGCSGT
jgi:hypothetical protein